LYELLGSGHDDSAGDPFGQLTLWRTLTQPYVNISINNVCLCWMFFQNYHNLCFTLALGAKNKRLRQRTCFGSIV